MKKYLLLLQIGCIWLGVQNAGANNLKDSTRLQSIVISKDSTHFVYEHTGKPFVVWGVNYDHDAGHPSRLIEEYWNAEWYVVVADFKEIKQLGANVVRIHLQLPKFMNSATTVNGSSLKQLAQLLKLAETTGLYLDITGLACYRKKDVPEWYDKMDYAARWEVQARFWEAVAKVCNKSPAIFCYDLMNEPLIPGKGHVVKEWLAGELGGYFFDQQLTLDIGDRTQKQVAKCWVDKLVEAIRKQDEKHMVTVGVIPLAYYFPGAKPLFYDKEVSSKLGFVSIHLYPKHKQVDKALAGLKLYEIGKPLIIEEMFPLECTLDDMDDFIEGGRGFADGWVSFYWGKPIEELAKGQFGDIYLSKWLEYFKNKSKSIVDDQNK
ncbi:MAG: cellulase family glycosylhydrolase [Mucilaginibacter sp.]